MGEERVPTARNGGGRCISGATVGTACGPLVCSAPGDAPLEPEHAIAKTASAAGILLVTVPRMVPLYAGEHTRRCKMICSSRDRDRLQVTA